MLYEFNEQFEGSQAVRVKPTSANSAEVTACELRPTTEVTRLMFHPKIVRNPGNPNNSVEGRITYEKKSRSDLDFPLDASREKITKRSIRKDDALELSLDSGETRALYDALNQMYSMYADIGGIPMGATSYVRIDSASRQLLELLKKDASAARMMGDPDTFELVKELLKLLTQGKTHEELGAIFRDLELGSLNGLSESLNLEQLRRAEELIAGSLTVDDEEYWQRKVFEKNPWIIGHIFSTPCMLFDSKAYVGGKAIDNKGGNLVDFLYQNKISKNVTLVEIKTPATKLLGSSYRTNCYSLSPELSGATAQVLSYRQSIMNEYANLLSRSSDSFCALHPECVIIIGNSGEFTSSAMRSTFENYRQNLNGVTIVTFDELHQKIRDLISLLSFEEGEAVRSKAPYALGATPTSIYDDDIPF